VFCFFSDAGNLELMKRIFAFRERKVEEIFGSGHARQSQFDVRGTLIPANIYLTNQSVEKMIALAGVLLD